MPSYKKPLTLYQSCIKQVYKMIYTICVLYPEKNLGEKNKILNDTNIFLRKLLPTSVLDELLMHHSNMDQSNPSMRSYYYFKTILHSQVKRFKAKNCQLKLSYWQDLFSTSFLNLKDLNLALSCNDDILKMIPLYCPNLEYLNATCRYERIWIGTNAATFSLSVTDTGLDYLCGCKKLKVLSINEPRSQSRGIRSSITYTGLRKLLTNVKTLEDITYTDIGSVIAREMHDIETLQLKVIRHFNATRFSIAEILRLCPRLEELYLTFFTHDDQLNVINEILKSGVKLRLFEIVNLNFGPCFDRFFQTIGNNLECLSLSNNNERITFSNLITIGNCCPNLHYLACFFVDNSTENVRHIKNIGQFSKLRDLFICGHYLDIKNLLIYCTVNAEYLKIIKITEHHNTSNIDNLFINIISPLNIKYIDVSSNLEFSISGIKIMIEKYMYLNYLSVYCRDDCTDLIKDIKDQNYDLKFVNKRNIDLLFN